jgi:hypothetical protein
MSNQKLIDYLVENDLLKDGFYTHETIAWKLLVDDDDLEQLSGQLQTYNIDQDQVQERDSKSFFHELLLNIFMSMIFNLSQIFELQSSKPDLDKFDMNDFYPIIKDKLTKVCIYPSVCDYEQSNEYSVRELTESKFRYCRIVLKNNKEDYKYLIMNNIPDDNDYFFIGNPRFVGGTDTLEEIFSVCYINKKIYKISFSTIQK